MNYDKTIVYEDQRPGFESYSMMNMGYPNIPMMPNMGFAPNNNQLEMRISNLEKRISNLENNISKLQNNIYPQATDYQTYSTDYSSYQNSMNMM